jgi:hypothetical protein
VDNPAWDHSTFSKNRDRLLDGEIAGALLAEKGKPMTAGYSSENCHQA